MHGDVAFSAWKEVEGAVDQAFCFQVKEGVNFRRIQQDNGGRFLSNDFKQFCIHFLLSLVTER